MSDLSIRSTGLPGGDLISALFDRTVMGLADKGAASNLVGERWADLASNYVATWPDEFRTIEDVSGDLFQVERVDRLDNVPRIAAVASKRNLQNPDLLIVGRLGQHVAVQAADAKFSVETARSKQVSVEMLSALLGIRPVVPELLLGVGETVHIVPGVFLCPDYSLTHLMLSRGYRTGRGILRTTVSANEIELVPVAPETFWSHAEGAELMSAFESVDGLQVASSESLAVGLYYFRLARAAVGLWHEATKPILAPSREMSLNIEQLLAETAVRTSDARSAFETILQWDSDVQVVRNQRSAIEHVASPPIPGKELRERVARIAARMDSAPPSANQVRRRVGSWYHQQVRDRVGVITPPVDDLDRVMAQVAAAGREIAPELDRELERIVRECIRESLEVPD